MIRWSSMTARLSITFVLFALLLLTGVGIFSYLNGRSALRANTKSELVSIAIEKQSALKVWSEERLQDIVQLADTRNVRVNAAALLSEEGDPGMAHDLLLEDLNNLVGPGRSFQEIMLLEAMTGEVLVSTKPLEEGKFHEDHPFFIQGRLNSYIQTVYYSTTLQSAAMTVSAPVYSLSGALLGVLAGNVSLEQMNTIVKRKTGLHASIDSFLVTSSFLFATQPRYITNPVVLMRGIHTAAVDRCLTHLSGVVLADDYRGVPAIISYSWLPEQQLCLIVKIDQAEAYASSQAFGKAVLIISGLALLLSAGLGVALAGSITRPIKNLVEGAQQIGQGNLDFKLQVARRDEIGRLADAFNQMGASLAEKNASLKEIHEKMVRQERLATLGQLAGSVGHELRNPLGVISNAIYFLKLAQPEASDTVQEYLEIIENETRNSNKIITDLLDYTRIRSIERKPSNVADLIERTLKRYPVPAQIMLEKTIQTELPMVMVDPSHVVQVFGNLLTNACQAMVSLSAAGQKARPGKTRIGTLTLGASLEGKFVKVSVEDTGQGILPENMGKLFEPLFTTKIKGIGLGLAISRKLLEANNGRIEASSQPGKGSTFTVFLPTREALEEVVPGGLTVK